MKAFKFLLCTLLVLSAFAMIGCSKDEEKGPSIIGTWVNSTDYETLTITFNKDNSFVEIYEWSYSGEMDKDIYTGRYTYENSTLTLYYHDGDVEMYSGVVVSETTLMCNGIVYIRR